MKTYQNATKALELYVLSTPISEQTFKELQASFRNDYLASKRYYESIITHRNPDEVKNALLRELNDYLITIQNRIEMRDSIPESNTSGFVTTTLTEMWRKDRSYRSLYKTIQGFCLIRDKNFTTIAIHMAEYRGLYVLYNKIRRQLDKSSYKYATPVS